MFKIILLAIQLNFSLGFMFNVANINIIHIQEKKNHILNSIDYDPSQIINKLARSADELDKYNLNQFLNEVNNHIETVSIIKNV